MDNVKVRLTVLGIPGTPKKYKPQDMQNFRKFLVKKFGEDIHFIDGPLRREFITDMCSYAVNMTREAFTAMTDGKNRPVWYHSKDWGRLSATQRLEKHFASICREKNGLCYKYAIMED